MLTEVSSILEDFTTFSEFVNAEIVEINSLVITTDIPKSKKVQNLKNKDFRILRRVKFIIDFFNYTFKYFEAFV
jgi:hypothetical protein